MTEIITNGPVQATFLVYGDFFMYKSVVIFTTFKTVFFCAF